MEWIGVIGIIVGLVFFVIAAMKGWNVLITSVVTAVIIAVTNGMGIADAMLGAKSSYVAGLASFVQKNLLIFIGAAILGEYIDKSGAAKSIAQAIIGKVGTKSPYLVLLAISAVGAILTYAGISMFVAMFALIPLARPIFKECNIPWHLFCAAWSLAACSFTMAMIPGVPAIAWINAANGCGVSMTAAPVLGIVGSVIAIAVSCVYIKFALKRAQAKGETYEVTVADSEACEQKETPGLFMSLLPLILLIVIIIAGSQLGVANVVYIGMIVAVVVSMIVFSVTPWATVRRMLSALRCSPLQPLASARLPRHPSASPSSTRPSSTCPAALMFPPLPWLLFSAASWDPARAPWALLRRTSSSPTWPPAVIRLPSQRLSRRLRPSAALFRTPVRCSACWLPWA